MHGAAFFSVLAAKLSGVEGGLGTPPGRQSRELGKVELSVHGTTAYAPPEYHSAWGASRTTIIVSVDEAARISYLHLHLYLTQT